MNFNYFTRTQVFVFMWAYGVPLNTTSALSQILQLNASGCVSPFVYVAKYEKFRFAVKQIYRRLCNEIIRFNNSNLHSFGSKAAAGGSSGGANCKGTGILSNDKSWKPITSFEDYLHEKGPSSTHDKNRTDDKKLTSIDI